jgi:DnaK suppressor protein
MDASGADSTKAVRALLEERRGDLLSRIAQFGANDPAETANLNFGKRIGDGTTYAVDRMNGAFQARTLYETVVEIDQALQRLDDGSYGLCVSCSAPIPEERLAALAWASMCVPCAGGRSRPAPRRP